MALVKFKLDALRLAGLDHYSAPGNGGPIRAQHPEGLDLVETRIVVDRRRKQQLMIPVHRVRWRAAVYIAAADGVRKLGAVLRPVLRCGSVVWSCRKKIVDGSTLTKRKRVELILWPHNKCNLHANSNMINKKRNAVSFRMVFN